MRLGTTFASACTRLMASLAASNSCCPPSQFWCRAWMEVGDGQRVKTFVTRA